MTIKFVREVVHFTWKCHALPIYDLSPISVSFATFNKNHYNWGFEI